MPSGRYNLKSGKPHCGLMTALPTTPKFMDYEAVYLPNNPFIKAESMDTMEYLALFFPFEKPDMVKRGIESM